MQPRWSSSGSLTAGGMRGLQKRRPGAARKASAATTPSGSAVRTEWSEHQADEFARLKTYGGVGEGGFGSRGVGEGGFGSRGVGEGGFGSGGVGEGWPRLKTYGVGRGGVSAPPPRDGARRERDATTTPTTPSRKSARVAAQKRAPHSTAATHLLAARRRERVRLRRAAAQLLPSHPVAPCAVRCATQPTSGSTCTA